MNPPEPDEVEVSVFGPGFGESLAVHLGFGEWMIVDSCLPKGANVPAALRYLRDIKVEPSLAVKLVIASHWHDDHIKGLGEVVRECASSKFWFSQALFSKEFIALTDLWQKHSIQKSPLAEFSQVMKALGTSGRLQRNLQGNVGFGFAVANKCIWKRAFASDIFGSVTREVYSLSPSDAAVKSALESIAAALHPVDGNLRQPSPRRPNQSSVVLWLKLGEARVLLGADMEEANNPYGGWNIIVNSAERPDGRATLLKVPHHGSATGEHAPVWTKMLTPMPFALLTPFSKLKNPLPTAMDVDRICSRTDNAFISATVRNRSQRRRSPEVTRTMREVLRWSRPIDENFGHIRARKKISTSSAADWKIELFGDACRLDGLQKN